MDVLRLTNLVLVDPDHGRNGPAQLLLAGGKVQEAGDKVSCPAGAREVDLGGRTVMPGAVDLHVHLTSRFGNAQGYALLARAGVTTAVDLAGPPEELFASWGRARPPVTVGGLEALVPGATLPHEDPSLSCLQDAVERARERGALGIKILGGHFPLTPEATAKALELCAAQRVFVVFHAGTTATGSDYAGLQEALDLAACGPFHLAHVNSYCRGSLLSARQEAELALERLDASPGVTSESYLSPWNGTSGACRGEEPESRVTCRCLQLGGYPPTRDGLRQAVQEGWARVQVAGHQEVSLQAGLEGVVYWEEQDTRVGVSFAVNPMDVLFLLAVDRRQGRLTLPVLASDGGGIPRNTILSQALLLHRFGALTLADLVRKTSLHPARILGLEGKGHLGPGADADVTVLDLERAQPLGTMVGGATACWEGKLYPAPARVLTAAAGVRTAAECLGSSGPWTVVDPSRGTLVCREPVQLGEQPAP